MTNHYTLLKRRSGRGVYGSLILVLVIVGFVLQFQWMQHVRESGAKGIVPNTFAEKLTRWMLQKKGVPLEETDVQQTAGAEKIVCGNCMGTGSILTPGDTKEICPICQGVGFHMVRRFDPADRICPFCGGMGRVFLPDTGLAGTCPRCDGRGLIRSHLEDGITPDGI